MSRREACAMAEMQILTRLLRVRELEEERSRQELEVAVVERNRWQREFELAEERRMESRRSFVTRLNDPDTAPRGGAMLEMELARNASLRVEPRLARAEFELAQQREEFLARRTNSRQVEVMVEDARRLAQEEAGRRAQQMLDDWYGRRRTATRMREMKRPASCVSESASPEESS